MLRRFRPDRLEFLPEQPHDEALRLLAASEVFVLPSYTEGFPNSVMEAMATGLAVVATDVGAVPEMLSEGCGLLVPPRDVVALRDALARVTADDALRAELGRRAREKARAEYAMGIAFKRLVDVWTQAVRAERVAPPLS